MGEQGRAALRRTEPGQRKASQGLLVLQRNQVSGSPVSAMAKTKLNPRAKPAATGDPRLREAQQRRLYAMSLHQLATENPADTVNKKYEATCYGQIERRLVDNEATGHATAARSERSVIKSRLNGAGMRNAIWCFTVES